ncbi:MAG: nucleoside hydrolase [Planctomycetes bacterium]|nr:nucleoside hydrolase [Planctomycetota bacterium]MBM4058208.1 nucleoside hydrolase [Planctomycetota bacterium]
MRSVAAWCLVVIGGTVMAHGAPPVPVIFDTDMCGDCDDVAALAMLHALESREQCRLLAVTVSASHPRAAPFVDCVNHFYGRTGIPVGVVRPGGVVEQSVYLKLADATWDDPAFAGRERYPHRLRDAADAAEAVGVLRAALAGAPDGAVVVIQVGFSTNLARLLDSPPDAVSPLPGAELVARKVKCLQLMAGAFQPIDGNAAYGEYNVVRDRAAAALVAERWPTEMVWSGFEIGIALPYPSRSILEDFRDVPHHPVAEAYRILSPPPQDRPSWDLTSVLDGVLGSRGYFDRSPPGRVTVTEKGATTFTAEAAGKHRYLILRDEAAKARVTEALVQLVSQPR